MKILNLGCGVKTSDKIGVTNIDWSIYLRLKNKKMLSSFLPLFFRGERLNRFRSLPDNIMVYNLAKGIPFSSDSIDVVYHSHMLEHLDRDVAEKFLIEVKRVLKVGGIHRIVVPNLEEICSAYVDHIALCEINPDEHKKHDSYIASMIEQSVRKESFGTSQQKPLRRFLEKIVLGDSRRRGENHQWMYDRINLKEKLICCGYKEVFEQKYNSSQIPNWNEYGLDNDSDGNQYKPGSLYIEARK
ncbi:class I SAM-dependent methyltransferase [Kistimonas asteriae]|uniref:class I SAM-dependent methyltransferase n=1 Tax=Kistimonas asteriae TaxID=517724 RepID=UPI001BA946DA|nr:methyltransferase domain-containing protein [Kistimonas asteriae]